MKRYKHNLSNYRLCTGAMGELMPIGLTEVLPGDTIQHSVSSVVRVTPLLAPVMHPVKVRIHHFFVPMRLLWDEWEDFITGTQDPPAGPPTIGAPHTTGGNGKKDVLHYLGCPLGESSGKQVSALPLYAYNMIYNEYFRDQDLAPERSLTARTLAKVAWEKDYFTSARPWTQKGDEITLPLGTVAPVVARGAPGTDEGAPSFTYYQTGTTGTLLESYLRASNAGLIGITTGTFPTDNQKQMFWDDPSLEADLSSATGVPVNDVRRMFALQRYQEARARYGSRFSEYLRYMGVTPSDARLQRPEYLGGGSTRLNFSEVLQTTPAAEVDTNGVGDLYGHGIAGVRGNAYRKFFEEHGYIVSLMSVRPKTIYQNGVPRTWLKRTKEDFYQKELAFIGQQGINPWEVTINSDNVSGPFGYNDRYREYRETPSQVLGDFTDVLDFWHLARDLPDDVTLNQAFIECDPSTRVFQVQTNDPLWIMVNHHMVARRIVPKSAAGKII